MGVILRRGPSEWVQVIRWDTGADTFTPGHWFHGRIYAERCDLSPSGERLIYFAAKHGRQGYTDPSYTNAWTAISRVPYLTAVALWPNRGTTYYGGGLFRSEDEVWVNNIDAHWPDLLERSLAPHPEHRPPRSVRLRAYPAPFWLHAYYPRLLRDGWTWHPDGKTRTELGTLWRRIEAMQARPPEQPDERLPHDLYKASDNVDSGTRLVLHLRVAYKGDTYALRDPTTGAVVDAMEGVGWADVDQTGRLVCARAGKLFEVRFLEQGGTLDWRELADFNDARPRLLPPPDWAKAW